MLFQVFLLSSLLGLVPASHRYCVEPTSTSADNSCETLDFYAANSHKYFTDNTSFVFLSGTHILGSISIENVSGVIFTGGNGSVTLKCNGSGGLTFQHASDIALINIHFVSCGRPLPESLQRKHEPTQAALVFGEVAGLLLESVSVSHSMGYGVLGRCVYDEFTVRSSTFHNNRGSSHYLGGNAAIQYTHCSSQSQSNIQILSSRFKNGSYNGSYRTRYATGLMLSISYPVINITLSDVSMENNKNDYERGFGGNLFVAVNNALHVKIAISESTFINGEAWLGAGVGISFSSSVESCTSLDVMFQNTEISNNTGILGSGLFYEF